MKYSKKLSRKQQKLNYIHIKNQICKASTVLGGLFYSHNYIHGDNQWVDFFFLSAHSKNIWNACISTAKLHYSDMVNDKVADEVNKMLGNDWHDHFPIFREERNSKTKNLVWIPIEQSPIEALGGLTREEWEEQKTKEIANSDQIAVFESIEIDYSYRFGIGLHIIKDVPGISIDIINAFIKEFIKNGEKPAISSQPLIFSYEDMQTSLTYLSNAIIEP